MKSVRVAVQEYDIELPLYIYVLGCCLVHDLDVANSTSTD